MKTFRLLCAALFLLALGTAAPAQESSEFATLRAKAEKGNGIAQYNLGLAYATGRGTAVDPIEAYVWLSLARENGARGRALDNLVATFDKATFAAAQQRLAGYKAALASNSKPAPPPVARSEAPALVPATGPAEEAKPAPPTTPAEDPALLRLRDERDALAAKLNELTGEMAALRAERDRLAQQATETEKSTHETSRVLLEQAHASEARIDELVRNTEALKAELGRTKQSLAALVQAPKPAVYPDLSGRVRELEAQASGLQAELAAARNAAPAYPDLSGRVRELETQAVAFNQQADAAGKQSTAGLHAANEQIAQLKAALAQTPPPAPDTAALDEKTRQLQAALAELDASRAFGRKVEDTLNKVNDEKTRQLQAAAAELEASRNFGRQVEDTLNKVNDQKVALEAALAEQSATASRTQQEIAALTQAREEARKAAAGPAYPDLSSRVRELEAQVAASEPAAAAQKHLADATAEKAALQQQLGATTAERDGLQAQIAQLRQQPAPPPYPDLRNRVHELESAVAAKPAYPDLSGKVSDLEAKLTAAEKLAAEKPAAPAYPDLSGKVTELEGQVTALKSTVTDSARELADTRDKLAAAAKPVAPAYPDLSGRAQELEAALAAAGTKSATQAAEAERARQEIAALTKAQEAAEQRVTALQTDLTAAQAQATSLTAERDDARHAQNELGSALTKLEEEKTRLAAAQGSTAETARQLTELGEKAAAADKQSTSLRQERDALSAKITDLAGNLATLQADRERMQRLLADTGKKLRDSNIDASRSKELEAKSAGLQGALASAEAQATSLTAERDAARRTQSELHDTITKLEQEKAQLSATLQATSNAAPTYPDLSGKVRELETKLAAAEKTVAEKPAAPAYPDLSGRVRELETQVAAVSQQADAAGKQSTADLHAANEQIAQLKATLAEVPKPAAYPDLSGRVRELEAQATGLQGELAAARNAAPAYPDLSGKVSELETKLAAAEKAAPAYPDLSGKVHELEAQVSSSLSAVAAAQTEADHARQELAATEKAAAEKPAAPAYPDLSGKVRELESAVADSSRQLVAAGTARTELQRKLDETTAALQNAAKSNSGDDSAQLRRERDELSGRLTGLAGELAQLRADRERMQKMLADAGKQMRDSATDAARIKELEAQATGLQGELAAARNAAPAYPDLSGKVGELETKLAAAEKLAAEKPAAPAYADLSGKVADLEGQVAALKSTVTDSARELADTRDKLAKPATPAYPDLSGRVSELEATLADARHQLAESQAALHTTEPVKAAPEADTTGLQKQLADTEDKLATALRGYAVLEHERDAQAAAAGKSTEDLTAEKNTLAAQVATLSAEVEQLKAGAQSSAGTTQAEITRLNEALTALQRTSAQTTNDLATTRTLARQLQGTNSVLAGENYQLKTMLARTTGAPGPVNVTPAAPPAVPAARTHVVAGGDSLSRISQRYYGTPNRWQEIYNANRDKLGNEGVLRIGTELRIP